MTSANMRPEPSAAIPESSGAIVFFDGVCGLCNSFVDFVLARDGGAQLRFSALQGETFSTTVGARGSMAGGPHGIENNRPAERLTSIVFWDGEQLHIKSEAVLRVVEALGGGWRLARLLRLVPHALRDSIYDFVANNRYRWFGKRKTCRLPSDRDKERFLP